MANPDPLRLSDRVLALPGAVNCAIVHNDAGEAVLFDTGQDRSYAKAIRRALEAERLSPIAIVTSHAHADHFGGNADLARRYGLPVLAPDIEASLMTAPYLEPVYLYHGARPLEELTTKWLQAPPSPVDRTIGAGPLDVLPGVAIEAIDASGHAHRQLAFQIDGVLLAADALFGASVLERYPIPFGQDVAAQLDAARALGALEVAVALPGHGEPTDDVAALAAQNIAAIERVSNAVERHAVGVGSEAVLKGVCDELGIALGDVARYHLNLCTVSAHLSYLRAEGRIGLALEGNRLLWTTG